MECSEHSLPNLPVLLLNLVPNLIMCLFRSVIRRKFALELFKILICGLSSYCKMLHPFLRLVEITDSLLASGDALFLFLEGDFTKWKILHSPLIYYTCEQTLKLHIITVLCHFTLVPYHRQQ